ncbi:hypothetical protein EI94DRAFT_1705763 [Lactarius quietus]|nr:hypothetical protein EI94DRAFT_1705763 [Lactarius quietus]
MSQSTPTSTSSSNFRAIFVAALEKYRQKTKTDLLTHPLATQLQSCNSSSDILAVLHNKVDEFEQSRSNNERLSRWLNSTINILYAFSATMGTGVGLIFSPANVISAGVGVLLLAAMDVSSSEEALADLFKRIEHFFKRLESYTEVPPTDAMTDMIVKIMVEVLNIFAIATTEVKQSRAKKFLKKLVGRKDIEDALKRGGPDGCGADMNLTHAVDNKVTGVGNKLKEVDDKMDVVIKVLLTNPDFSRVARWKGYKSGCGRYEISIDESQHRVRPPPWGTADWFSRGGIFAEWKTTGSLLWIYGKPGSGKSILCSTIIQDVACLREAGSALMAYFYFDFRDLDKHHRRNLLPSLLIQISAQSRPCCDILSHLHSAHDNGETKPSDRVMIQCLKDMLALHHSQPVYIILDALDECPNWAVSLHEESGQKKDIVDYINSVVYFDSETMMKRWREDEKKMVVEAVSEKADGMFRWVFCQLDTLRQCLPSCVRHTLEQLPESLDETYERIMMDIQKANKGQAYRMLQCLAVAVRPLSVAELAEILAFEFDAANGGTPKLNANWRWEDHEQAVLSTCSSLITIVTSDYDYPVVQFSHFSVKEFLMSDRLSTKDISRYHIILEDANTLLASACLGVLLQGPVDENGAATAPLARYATENWVSHAQRGAEYGMSTIATGEKTRK